jgi:GxxExxY protein
MHTDAHKLIDLIETTIGCVYGVANTLGSGFLEKVYENALAYELRKSGGLVEQEKWIKFRYEGVVVGDYMAEVLGENTVLVELKAVRALDSIHIA